MKENMHSAKLAKGRPSGTKVNEDTDAEMEMDLLTRVGDRRAYNRQAVSYPINCRMADLSFAAKACNLSPGGMFILSESTPEIGTKLEMDLLLGENKNPLCLKGTVVWKSGDGVGVCFSSMPEKSDHAIFQSIESQ